MNPTPNPSVTPGYFHSDEWGDAKVPMRPRYGGTAQRRS